MAVVSYYQSNTVIASCYQLDTAAAGRCRPVTAATGRCRPNTAVTSRCRPVTAIASRCRSVTAVVGRCRLDIVVAGRYRSGTVLAGRCRPDSMLPAIAGLVWLFPATTGPLRRLTAFGVLCNSSGDSIELEPPCDLGVSGLPPFPGGVQSSQLPLISTSSCILHTYPGGTAGGAIE